MSDIVERALQETGEALREGMAPKTSGCVEETLEILRPCYQEQLVNKGRDWNHDKTLVLPKAVRAGRLASNRAVSDEVTCDDLIYGIREVADGDRHDIRAGGYCKECVT